MATADKDNIQAVVSNLKQSTGNEHQSNIEAYKTEATAAVEKVGKAPGVPSVFNPFNVFRYSRHGMNTETYDRDKHYDFDSNVSPGDSVFSSIGDGTTEDVFKSFSDKQAITENPTASEIVNWAKRTAKGGDTAVHSPTPYTSTDFIWCKYYGKVPNNRLVTLRRYPVPVEDNLLMKKGHGPLVPLAQAVTWFGKDVDNELNKIINLDWGFNWKSISADVKDVDGNEIDIDSVLDQLSIDKSSPAAVLIKSQLFGVDENTGKIDMASLTGLKKKMQDYSKDLYGENGPYWNRVLGPVNVIHETLIRTKGFKSLDQMPPVVLNFNYSLRSFRGMNPKIAFLDLLTNFLSLTYNSAPFWGGDIRYFENPKLSLGPLGMNEPMLAGNPVEAVKKGLESMSGQAAVGLQQITKILGDIAKAGTVGTGKNATLNQKTITAMQNANKGAKGGVTNAGDLAAANIAALFSDKLGAFMQKPLAYRSVLDGRSIGEWHVAVGNPMNPIAMMGNLVVSDVKMEVGETLGLDDFPTEFNFKVTLKHGRARAKQDIESIFNLGNGRMAYSPLSEPSSSSNSYGKANTGKANEFYNDAKVTRQESDVSQSTKDGSEVSAAAMSSYRSRVDSMYGGGFAESKILPSYFKDYKIKD